MVSPISRLHLAYISRGLGLAPSLAERGARQQRAHGLLDEGLHQRARRACGLEVVCADFERRDARKLYLALVFGALTLTLTLALTLTLTLTLSR